MSSDNVTDRAMIRFFTRGKPSPKGSPRPIRNQHTGKTAMVIDSERARDFGYAIACDAAEALGGLQKPLFPAGTPVAVSIEFVFPWRKGDLYEKGPKAGQPKPGAPLFHTVYPDVDKLVRTVLDGLKHGGAYYDDSQVVLRGSEKRYGHEPGARITIEPIAGPKTIGELEANLFARQASSSDEEAFG